MASRKMRAKRRQERMQQLQRNTAMPPAQESIEELKATNPLEAQQTLLPDEREIIPAKEVEQRIECVPLERIVTEQYQRILNMKNVAGIVKNFETGICIARLAHSYLEILLVRQAAQAAFLTMADSSQIRLHTSIDQPAIQTGRFWTGMYL